jgi:hypothetical protein
MRILTIVLAAMLALSVTASCSYGGGGGGGQATNVPRPSY